MTKIARATGIILLLSIFLSGTIGLSVWRHLCSCNKTQYFAVMPEIVGHHAQCCCETTGSMMTREPAPAASSLSSGDCCKNIRLYLKANFVALPLVALAKQLNPEPATMFFMPALTLQPKPQVTVRNVFLEYYPPPLYGSVLIHFLHQIKIPSPVTTIPGMA